MSITTLGLTIAILATWRLTHLLWAEDGPWNAFAHLRRVAGERIWGRLLDCFYCLSLWAAAPMAWWLGERWPERGVLWLAVSGGAIVLERLLNNVRNVPAAPWRVDSAATRNEEEPYDVMLR